MLEKTSRFSCGTGFSMSGVGIAPAGAARSKHNSEAQTMTQHILPEDTQEDIQIMRRLGIVIGGFGQLALTVLMREGKMSQD